MMFNVQSHPMEDYVVGKNSAGQPIIIGLRYPYVCCVIFEPSGALVEVRVRRSLFLAKAMREGGPYFIEDPDFQEKLRTQIASWQEEIGFREQPITIKQFAIPEISLAIEDLPRHFQQFKNNLEDFSEEEQREYPELIDVWVSEGNFVLWWDTDYYLDKQGEII